MVRNKYNFLNSFWMKTDTNSVGYCRIRIWNRIEKINENRIWMYLLYYRIKFEYGYGYPYWCLNGYEYRISAIHFGSLSFSSPAVHAHPRPWQHIHGLACERILRRRVADRLLGSTWLLGLLAWQCLAACNTAWPCMYVQALLEKLLKAPVESVLWYWFLNRLLTLTNDHFQALTWSENHESLHFLHAFLFNKVPKLHFTF